MIGYETTLEIIICLLFFIIICLWSKNIELHQTINGMKDYYKAEMRSLRLSRFIAMKDRC